MKIYFIGIGGVSMSGLAIFCAEQGHHIFGSNDVAFDCSHLKNKNISVFYPHRTKHIKNANLSKKDIVVYTSAISNNNCELKYAKKIGCLLLKREVLLGSILNLFSQSVAVSGSHGKTTVSALITHILKHNLLSPCYFIGGQSQYGNYGYGKDCAVCEACEYKRAFYSLDASIKVVLGVSLDHTDYYKDLSDIQSAFFDFLNLKNTSIKVINGDDDFLMSLKDENSITFGLKPHNDFYASNLISHQGCYSFTLNARHNISEDNLQSSSNNYEETTRTNLHSSSNNQEKTTYNIQLNSIGQHMVVNTLCAIAVCTKLGVSINRCINALSTFLGVQRRLTSINYFSFPLTIDYAHHPDELVNTINSLKESSTRNIIAVFQPHTYSRTKAFINEFALSLLNAHKIVLLPVYPARERRDSDGTSLKLYQTIKRYYLNNKSFDISNDNNTNLLTKLTDDSNSNLLTKLTDDSNTNLLTKLTDDSNTNLLTKLTDDSNSNLLSKLTDDSLLFKQRVFYTKNFRQCAKLLKKITSPDDQILLLGAGDVNMLINYL